MECHDNQIFLIVIAFHQVMRPHFFVAFFQRVHYLVYDIAYYYAFDRFFPSMHSLYESTSFRLSAIATRQHLNYLTKCFGRHVSKMW